MIFLWVLFSVTQAAVPFDERPASVIVEAWLVATFRRLAAALTHRAHDDGA